MNILKYSGIIILSVFALLAQGQTTRDNILIDVDNNRYILKSYNNNILWMTENLSLNVPGSYCYAGNPDNCKQYGRLYTWEAAQKVCTSLGEGWRLPTGEDWQALSETQAVAAKDSVEVRKIAFQSLMKDGSAHFNAVLGGGRNPDGSYARIEAHGFYWTATQNDEAYAWFANFAKGSQALYMQKEGEKERAFSVRCVK